MKGVGFDYVFDRVGRTRVKVHGSRCSHVQPNKAESAQTDLGDAIETGKRRVPEAAHPDEGDQQDRQLYEFQRIGQHHVRQRRRVGGIHPGDDQPSCQGHEHHSPAPAEITFGVFVERPTIERLGAKHQ